MRAVQIKCNNVSGVVRRHYLYFHYTCCIITVAVAKVDTGTNWLNK